MRLIKEIQEQDINPGAPTVNEEQFKTRAAARAVVIDANGKVALLFVGRHRYHKLPGGGIDGDENIRAALERELLEEIGCKARIISEVGQVIEHRNMFELIQTSYCFKAELLGEKGQPDFTKDELENQFSIVWAGNIQSAVKILETDNPDDYEGKFIKKRDLAILKAAST